MRAGEGSRFTGSFIRGTSLEGFSIYLLGAFTLILITILTTGDLIPRGTFSHYFPHVFASLLGVILGFGLSLV
jgi:hypothetical protein